jgi:hypothetical protein
MSLHRERTHPDFVEGCFGCKATTLELHPGDAAHMRTIPKKKWDNELNAYADARRQGIQPAGTSMKAIKDAHKASENLGRAYDGGKMPPAHRLANSTKAAKAVNEVGM